MTDTPDSPIDAQTDTVELDTPIKRGNKSLGTITVRKPRAGALRGTSLTDLLNMDVQALTRVLPRITDPALTEHELNNLDPADLVQLGTAVSGFLLAKRFKQADG